MTRWRMDLAAQRFRNTDDTVGAIARSLGYTSEYAFNRAFRPGRQITPATTASKPGPSTNTSRKLRPTAPPARTTMPRPLAQWKPAAELGFPS